MSYDGYVGHADVRLLWEIIRCVARRPDGLAHLGLVHFDHLSNLRGNLPLAPKTSCVFALTARRANRAIEALLAGPNGC
jgi:hypothetical protein